RHGIGVAGERAVFVPHFAAALPRLGGLVAAAGDEPSVVGRRDGVDRSAMAFARRDAPAEPRLQRAVVAARDDAVARHDDARDRALVPAPRLFFRALVQIPLTEAIRAAAEQFFLIVDRHEAFVVRFD